jgi:hypothetical protein
VVIAEGLTAGELVVTEGVQKLRDGSAVEIVQQQAVGGSTGDDPPGVDSSISARGL